MNVSLLFQQSKNDYLRCKCVMDLLVIVMLDLYHLIMQITKSIAFDIFMVSFFSIFTVSYSILWYD